MQNQLLWRFGYSDVTGKNPALNREILLKDA